MADTETRSHGAEAVFAGLLPFAMAAVSQWVLEADQRFVLLAFALGLAMALPAIASWRGFSSKHPGVAASTARLLAAIAIVSGLALHKRELEAVSTRMAHLLADSTTLANAPTPVPVGRDTTTAARLGRYEKRQRELGKKMNGWRAVLDKAERLETSSEHPDLAPYFARVSTDSAWLVREYDSPTAEGFGQARDPQYPTDDIHAWWILEKHAQAKFDYLSRLR
jgi:hypothetical protein